MNPQVMPGSRIGVERLLAPGMSGTNLTLSPDPRAEFKMPGGYRWSVRSILQPAAQPQGTSNWVTALAVVAGFLGVVVVMGGLVLLFLRKRQRRANSRGTEEGGSHWGAGYRSSGTLLDVGGTLVLPKAGDPVQDALAGKSLQGHRGSVELGARSKGTRQQQQQQLNGHVGHDRQQHQEGDWLQYQSQRQQQHLGTEVVAAAEGGDANSGAVNGWHHAVSSTMLTILHRRVGAHSRTSQLSGTGPTARQASAAKRAAEAGGLDGNVLQAGVVGGKDLRMPGCGGSGSSTATVKLHGKIGQVG